MFEQFGGKLTSIFDGLRRKGVVRESDLKDVLSEIRIALLEADVALDVVKQCTQSVEKEALGQKVFESISPAQLIIKIVHDHLVRLLGEKEAPLNLATTPPFVILMMGLQGSGKTTSSAKLAYHLKTKQNKRILLASLDVYRPAAQEQLATLGEANSLDVLPIVPKQKPLDIAKRALKEARSKGYDGLILDTAGRLHIDEDLMDELQAIHKISKPIESLLVADSLTGQDAVRSAKAFHERIAVTGIILTRMDGDGRGGAALSMASVTQCPIKFLGLGESITALEPCDPKRLADRILDRGDVVSLVEKAQEEVSEDEAVRMERRMRKGLFTFNDLAKQLDMMQKMGGMGGIMGLLPGMRKMKKHVADSAINDQQFIQMRSIIYSMTKKERKNPGLLNASRKKRIAVGSGTSVQEINRLLKMHKQMAGMVKKMSKMDPQQMMGKMDPSQLLKRQRPF